MSFLLEPVGPCAPALLGVERRALLLVLLVDRLDFGAQCLAGLGIQQLFRQSASGQVLDRRTAQAAAALRGFYKSLLAAPNLLQLVPTCRGQCLPLHLVSGIQLACVDAEADRLLAVLPRRGSTCLRWLERAKPRLQARLGKVAGYRTRTDPCSVTGLNHEPIGSDAKLQAVVSQCLVQLLPGLRALDLLQAFTANPSHQAFHAGMLLHVTGPAFGKCALADVVHRLKAVLLFQHGRDLPHRPIRLERLMHRVADGMDLVDGDVDVQVVGVAMHGTDALMLGITECGAYPILNLPQHVSRRVFPRRKAHQQMIGLVASRPSVAVLRCQYLRDGIADRGGVAVRQPDLA